MQRSPYSLRSADTVGYVAQNAIDMIKVLGAVRHRFEAIMLN
jgi:hypothetical protein